MTAGPRWQRATIRQIRAAVDRVMAGESIAAVARDLGAHKETLRYHVIRDPRWPARQKPRIIPAERDGDVLAHLAQRSATVAELAAALDWPRRMVERAVVRLDRAGKLRAIGRVAGTDGRRTCLVWALA